VNRFLLFLSIATLLLNGCKKEFKAPTWDADLIFPIAKTTLAIADLKFDSVPELTLSNDGVNPVNIIYQNSLFSIDFDSLFQVPDTSLEQSFSPFFAINLSPGQQIWTGQINNKYKLKDIELKTVTFQSGKLVLDIENTLTEKIIINFELSKGTINGIPWVKQIEVPAGSQFSPANKRVEYDATDLMVDLTGDNGTAYNAMIINYTMILDPDGNATTANVGDKVSLTNTFQGLTPAYARGYFGQILEQDVLNESISEMKNVIGGNLKLDAFDMELTITNKLGVDLQSTLNSLTSINSNTTNEVSLTHSLIGNSINLNRAKETGNAANPVSYEVLKYPINKNNSNVIAFLENIPDSLSMSVDVRLNPLGNISANNDFVYYENGLDLGLNINLPLSFSMENLSILDTLEFKLDSSDAYQNINGGVLRLFANNYFPIGLNIDLEVTDSLFSYSQTISTDKNTILPADVINAPQTIGKESILEIPIDQDIIESLYNGELLVLRASMNTSDAPNIVDIYNHYKCDIQIVADFNYLITE
jgi:hypothetical protein